MLKNSMKKVSSTLLQYVILNCISVIVILAICLRMAEAKGKGPDSMPDGERYVWYNGDQEKYVWLSDDEIAIFPKQGTSRAKRALERRMKDLGCDGEIIKENDFVIFMRLPKRRNRGDLEIMKNELQKDEEVQCVSPIFYLGHKNSGSRMSLTGKIIIHFFPDWDKDMIMRWIDEKGLRLIKSFDFSSNTFLVDAGSPVKSLETANDIYLSGETLYAYPNWLKTRDTREDFIQSQSKKTRYEKYVSKHTEPMGRTEENEIVGDIETIEQNKDTALFPKKAGDQIVPYLKDNQAGIRSVMTCYPWAEDFWTGSSAGTYGYNKTIFIEGMHGDEGRELRGFAKFDLSGIPDGSIIRNVDLHVFCFKDVGVPYIDIRRLTSDPVTASRETIFKEAGSGTLYVNNWAFSDGYSGLGQWEMNSLGQIAARDLQSSLGQDWFAIGFLLDDFSTSYAWCRGWDSFLYQPYIVVDYDPVPCNDDDPLFSLQWHLENTGQCGIVDEDVNVVPVWNTYTGSSSIIAIVDSGLEIRHEDIIDNVVPELCWDYVDGDMNPTSTIPHGTACAGAAAARGFNCLGVRGVAPFCRLAGYRLIGALTDENEADALIRNKKTITIYSNSWGPEDGGEGLDNPGPLTEAALADGVTNGRDGKGNVYVWAGGNGGENDNSNYDGYANSRYTIAVAASDDSGIHPDYSEMGANLIINAPSSGGNCAITTTDLTGPSGYDHGSYCSDFGGTSAAAALVSGVIALMTDANPNLSWRDVQHILIETAEQNDPSDPDWTTNGAGYPINHKYGFGRVDADAAVNKALSWTPVRPEVSIEKTSRPYKPIPDNNVIGISDTIEVDENIKIEFIEVYFNASDHGYWGDLEIELLSPMGTKSILAEKHISGSSCIFNNWRFGTIRHFGEDSEGYWTLSVKDLANSDIGTFQSWTVRIFGYEIPRENQCNYQLPFYDAFMFYWFYWFNPSCYSSQDIIIPYSLPDFWCAWQNGMNCWYDTSRNNIFTKYDFHIDIINNGYIVYDFVIVI